MRERPHYDNIYIYEYVLIVYYRKLQILPNRVAKNTHEFQWNSGTAMIGGTFSSPMSVYFEEFAPLLQSILIPKLLLIQKKIMFSN